jgi:hypothetical protein
MTVRDRDDDFARRAKAVFDDSVAELDAPTRSKLTRARNRALEPHRRGGLSVLWLPSPVQAAVGAALVVIAVGWLSVVRRDAEPDEVAVIAGPNDWELLLGEEDLELFEDLEFYSWLDEQPELSDRDDESDDGAG